MNILFLYMGIILFNTLKIIFSEFCFLKLLIMILYSCIYFKNSPKFLQWFNPPKLLKYFFPLFSKPLFQKFRNFPCNV